MAPLRDIFLSYEHTDHSKAKKLAESLEHEGWTVWWDPRIPPGQTWATVIESCLKSSRCVVVLWSETSIKSKWVNKEARFADKFDLLVPALIHDVKPPFEFEHIQAANLIDWDGTGTEGFSHLTAELRSRLQSPDGQTAPAIESAQPQPKPATNVQRGQQSEGSRYFEVQRQIISHHAGRYVHRLGVEAALDRFLKVHRRGYFILTGGPGFGKTAVACHLIAQRRPIHHLIKRLEGRAEPRLILGSLLRQLADRSNRSVEFMVDLPALTETFETMLAVLALQERPVLVVIDGLDELPDDMTSNVPFLPGDALPDGMFMVLTCRRGLRLDRLQEDLTEVPWILHELGPLSSSEVDQLVKRQGQSLAAADLGLIAQASHGNPLYLHALIDELTSNPAFDLHQLPPVVEGYFRRAVKRISDQEVATGAIAVLAASRTPLTEIDLSTITGLTRAQIREQVIRPIRAFLAESEAGYAFYHHSFAEFVRNEVVDDPSLRSAHAAIAAWLLAPERRDGESCWRSLAYHLFESGDAQAFHQTIDEVFLGEKVRRCGYAVLEDVELLTQSMIREGDLRLVERGVAIVESLRRVAGGDLMTDVERTVQFAQAVSRPDRVGLSKQVTTADVDVFVRMVPRIGVSADFAEVVTDENGIWAVIGDVPASGLKSAFVARFVANLFRQIVQKAPNARARELIAEIGRRIEPFGNVARMSMQCVRIDVTSGMMHIANAGHPFPALFSVRWRKCDRLPIRGRLLDGNQSRGADYESRSAEIQLGDVLVLVSDGLTEASRLEDPYGFRYTSIVEQNASESAKVIAERILAHWRAHTRNPEWIDDVTVVVVAMRRASKSST